jgi:hypothetical protein
MSDVDRSATIKRPHPLGASVAGPHTFRPDPPKPPPKSEFLALLQQIADELNEKHRKTGEIEW